MRLYEDIDFTTLTWVKPELDETLRQARIALESFVEDTGDVSQMRYCATYLHQVHGTLRMVELYGAAMVAEEMEQLARSLLEQEGDREEAFAVLMRGIVQLPDYLERLQGGHRDIPIVLLPLLNELREARGEKGLGESALFSPDLGRELPSRAAGPSKVLADSELREQAETLRAQYQAALLNWLRDDGSASHISALAAVCDRLVECVVAEPARRLFWVAAGTLEALQSGAFEASKSLKQALGRVEREIKRLADGGEQAFRADPPLELTRQLLYYVAHAPTDYGRIRELREVFALDRYIPSETELAHARGSMTGHNRALLDTVSNAIKDDLLRVKDALDLHMRSSSRSSAELSAEAEVLDRVGDTLGMLGLGVPRRVVQEQRQALFEVSTGQREGDEGTLLDIAGALLYVEASLDDQVAQLGTVSASALDGQSEDVATLSPAESRKVLEAVVKEAIGNFVQARQCFVAFVETSWDSAQLDDVPRLLDEVGGALRMLEVQRAPEYLAALRRFSAGELLQRRRVPNPVQLEMLADALSSLEYFLESLRDQRGGRERILDTCEKRLEALGCWPPAQQDALASAPVASEAAPSQDSDVSVFDWPSDEIELQRDTPPGAAPTDDAQQADVQDPGEAAGLEQVSSDAGSIAGQDELVIEFDEARAFASPGHLELATPEPMASDDDVAGSGTHGMPPAAIDHPDEARDGEGAGDPAGEAVADPSDAAVAGPPASGFEGAGDEIDDEIREVFLEEFQEEIENLGELLPSWSANPQDLDRLRPIRRVFHTLKGSGRLVGALALGEFSWRIESALNRVLDNSRSPGPEVVALVETALAALPELRDSLAGTGGVRVDIQRIQEVADRVAKGEDVRFDGSVAVQPARRAEAALPGAAVQREEADESTNAPAEAHAAHAEPDAVPVEGRDEADVGTAEESAQQEDAFAADEHVESVPVGLDPVLFEILKAEVHGHLETVDAWLEASATSGQRATDPLLRAVHTMNGAFAMTEIPVVTELTAPLEGYVKRLLASRQLSTASARSVVAEAADAIRQVVRMLELESPRVPLLGDLPLRVAALRDTLPELTQPLYAVDAESEPEELVSMLPETVDLEPADTSGIPAFPGDAEDAAGDEAAAEGGDAPAGDAVGGQSDEEPATEESIPDMPVEAVDETPVVELPEEPMSFDMPAQPDAPGAEQAGFEVRYGDLSGAAAPTVGDEPEMPASDEHESGADAGHGEIESPESSAIEDAGEFERVVEPEVEPDAHGEPVGIDVSDAPDHIEAAVAPGDETSVPEAVDEEERLLRAALEPETEPGGSLDLAEIDVELLDLFLEEARDLLDHSDQLSAGLRDAPEDREIVTGLQRDLHTLKGGARMAGVPEIGDLGHVMESLLEAVAEGRRELGRPGVRLLEGGFDRLHRMVVRVGDRESLATPGRLIAAFEAMSRGQQLADVQSLLLPVGAVEPGVVDEAPPSEGVAAFTDTEAQTETEAESEVETEVETESESESEPEPEAEPEAETEAETEPESEVRVTPELELEPELQPLVVPEPIHVLAPLSDPLDIDSLAEDEDGSGIRSPQEQVRIRADLLDRLVNYAGEVAIYRARLEQQLGGFRGNLVELDATNSRLREQLRKLEIETEAQIIARYQREADESERDFDPLELDRFSTLQQLTRALSESASDLGNLQASLEDQTRQYETLLLQQSRVSSDLQEGLMRTRMVPFDSLVPRLRRVLRQASSDSGKQAQLKVEGAQGEMDRNVLERMTAPLEHMLRNAVAHGLESPDARRKAGKDKDGTVGVAISREGSEMVIAVFDDGAGLDYDAIREKAIQRGLLKAGAQVSDDTLAAFILETGFSTAGQVSKLAGRGVGMDVVYSEIRQLGGALGIRSQPGEGTRFEIRLPFTLAVTQAVFVRIGETSFAVPIASVQGVGRISRDELDAQLASETPVYGYAGEDYAIHDLGRLLGQAPAKAGESLQMPLLLARSGDLRAAICVDQVLGSREIVVKPTGPQISSIPGIFGATVMGDGGVVIILDVAPLVRRQVAEPRQVEAVPEVLTRRVPLVMVVDDSITMRKVSSRVLERNNYEVMTAKDGVDAIEKMADRVPDAMLLDIEMPRMDGYELATHMRNDARLAGVPIIMITSRTGEKHRQRAFEIGVNRYLGKPYQEAELVRNVQDLLAMDRDDD